LGIINGSIYGCGLSNDGTAPNSVLDVAACQATDSTNAHYISGSAFTKSTAGAWASGTGSNGMGNGLTITASTWYHVFAIINSSNYDVYFDTSITAANKPSGTTYFRYIGSFKTDASSHILAFSQAGQYFYWTSAPTDLSSGAATTATLFTLSVPPGINTIPLMLFNAGASSFIWSPLIGSTYPNGSQQNIGSTNPTRNGWYMTNTSAQLYYKVNSSSLTVFTEGYINPHVAPIF